MNDLTRSSELLKLLDIECDEITATRVRGSVVADERHHQPWGIVHGGLYTTVIETFATVPSRRAAAGRRGPDPAGTHPAALAGRDPPARRTTS